MTTGAETARERRKRRAEPVSKLLKGIDPDLKRRLRVAADGRGANMNDVAVGVLAEHYGVNFEPSGRSAEIGESLDVVLRMPPVLARKIDVEAAREQIPRRDVMLRILCEEFGVPFEPGGRWPQR